MTPEEAKQAETVAETSAGLRSYIWARYRWTNAPEQLTSAANLIDSQSQKIEAMQKQLNAYALATQAAGSLMQKQYTEAELREVYVDCFSEDTGEVNTWDGWIECARHFGLIKE